MKEKKNRIPFDDCKWLARRRNGSLMNIVGRYKIKDIYLLQQLSLVTENSEGNGMYHMHLCANFGPMLFLYAVVQNAG